MTAGDHGRRLSPSKPPNPLPGPFDRLRDLTASPAKTAEPIEATGSTRHPVT